MEKPESYILYGASFDPPHVGHFSAISQMLEEYDKVIVFPYPKKYTNGREEKLPPIGQRMKMLQIFALDFFPQISDRLMIIDLATQLKHKDRVKEGVLHTYDYSKFVKSKLPANATLSVCLGFEAQNVLRKEDFHKENEIKEEFTPFYLQEENTIKSEELRKFFSTHKSLKSQKDEEYIRYAVGNALAEHIFTNGLYNIKKKVNLKNPEEDFVVPEFKKMKHKI